MLMALHLEETVNALCIHCWRFFILADLVNKRLFIAVLYLIQEVSGDRS